MNDDAIDRIWKLADRIDPCLLGTWDGSQQQSRPVYARVRRGEGRIYILTDRSGHKHLQIDAHPDVTLSFADVHANDYVVIHGSASVSRDQARISDVWTFKDVSFWETPENPDLLLITVVPEAAEIWDGSNLAISGVKVLAERLVGADVELVDHHKVDRI